MEGCGAAQTMRIQLEGAKDAEAAAAAGPARPVVKKKTVKRKVVKPATPPQLPASVAPAIPPTVPDAPPADFVEASVTPPLLVPATAAAPRTKRRNSRVAELRVATDSTPPPVAGSGSDTNLASSARTAVSLPSGIGGANPTPPSGSTPPRTSHLASISETALGDHAIGLVSTSAPDLPVTKRQPTAGAAAGHSRSPATTWLPRGRSEGVGGRVGGRAGGRAGGTGNENA